MLPSAVFYGYELLASRGGRWARSSEWYYILRRKTMDATEVKICSWVTAYQYTCNGYHGNCRMSLFWHVRDREARKDHPNLAFESYVSEQTV